MNELIENLFRGFSVDGVSIPVSFMFYYGHEKAYITYQKMDADNSLSGDDELIGYVDFYDFDVYSKGNITKIVESVKTILKQAGFVWQPSRSSKDMFEVETGYYHKTLNFAIYRMEDD